MCETKQAADGGPAFPGETVGFVIPMGFEKCHPGALEEIDSHQVYSCGMSLRDWFAGRALSGIIVNHRTGYPSDVASTAYKIAEAMIAQRERIAQVKS